MMICKKNYFHRCGKLVILLVNINHIIEKAHDDNGIVFVHCAMGKSRSVCVIIIYLMIYEGLSLE